MDSVVVYFLLFFYFNNLELLNYYSIMTDPVNTTPSEQTTLEYLKYLGGRKFTLSVLTILLSTALLVFKHIPANVWQIVVTAVITLYLGANVAQRVFTKEE